MSRWSIIGRQTIEGPSAGGPSSVSAPGHVAQRLTRGMVSPSTSAALGQGKAWRLGLVCPTWRSFRLASQRAYCAARERDMFPQGRIALLLRHFPRLR